MYLRVLSRLRETLSWFSMKLLFPLWYGELEWSYLLLSDYPYFLQSLSFITLLVVLFISHFQSLFLFSTHAHWRGKLEGSVSWCSNLTHCLWAGGLSFSSQGWLLYLVQSPESTECPDYILQCWQNEVRTLFVSPGHMHSTSSLYLKSPSF